ncbi:uncharacterized protein B0P05DRAFT_189292 [Gilbertella persicaria]|uniref:uncharacterized protein n=1 Tax=Gilbertella persicaria TaxID=101096 RepID=UPI00221E77FC|nr:uncharacterized protein B0P05DRAFT_189292 [Gilbertella persicaria]KAI8069771.1 hypothetical protein B0P05DRAFT_189292 [Gilbertella persicaria]
MSVLSTKVTEPAPILHANSYPTAPTIVASTNASPCLQLILEKSETEPLVALVNNKKVLYYYQEPLSDNESPAVLYDTSKSPLWRISDRDWHRLSLVSGDQCIVISLTPPLFRFMIDNHIYHWQTIQTEAGYSLKCYHTESKALLAELDDTTLSLYHHNPFRTQLDHTGVILSGLLVHHYMSNLLASDPSGLDESDTLSFTQHYPGHQSLVGDTRWSAQSFKSIELDPGIWRCWWGYKFWWSWLPCCMPGGCCDRVCIRMKGKKARKRTLSKQGWQQQHY